MDQRKTNLIYKFFVFRNKVLSYMVDGKPNSSQKLHQKCKSLVQNSLNSNSILCPIENIINNNSSQKSSRSSFLQSDNRKLSQQENQTLVIQYRHLSQAYDNAQQKILDLEDQLRIETQMYDDRKQRIEYLEELCRERFEGIDMSQLIKELCTKLESQDAEQFIVDWIQTKEQQQILVQQLTNENSILKQQSHQFLELNNQLNQDLECTFKELTDRTNELSEKDCQLDELIEYVDDLKGQLKEVADQKEFLLNELAASKANINVLQDQLQLLLTNSNNRNQELENQRLDFDNLRCEKNILQERCSKFDEQNKELQREIDILVKDNEELNQEVQQCNDYIQLKQEKERENVQANFQRVYEDLSQSRIEIRQLREELSNLETKNHSLLEQASKSEVALRNVKQILEQEHRKACQQQEKYEELIQSLHEDIEMYKELSQKNQGLESIMREQELQYESVQSELQVQGQIIMEYQDAMQVVIQELELEGLQNINDFSKIVKESLERLVSNQKQFGELQKINSQLQQQLDSSNKANENLSKQIEKFNEKANQIDQEERNYLASKVKQSEAMVTQLQQQNSQLHQHMDHIANTFEQEHQESQKNLLKQSSLLASLKSSQMKDSKFSKCIQGLLEKFSKTMGGDYVSIIKELIEVYRESCELQVKIQLNQNSKNKRYEDEQKDSEVQLNILNCRIRSLDGEITQLEQFEKNKAPYYQQLERTNFQLQNEIQILQNEIDLKEYQKRGKETSQFISEQPKGTGKYSFFEQTQKISQTNDTQVNSTKQLKANQFYLQGSAKKLQLQANDICNPSLLKNQSTQFRKF